MNLTTEDIGEGQRLHEAATPGPWSAHEDCELVIVSDTDPNMSLLGLDKDDTAIIYESADQALIVWLRNNAEALLESARLAAMVRQAVKDVDADPSTLDDAWFAIIDTVRANR